LSFTQTTRDSEEEEEDEEEGERFADGDSGGG
jgi:hypothetical protein